MMPSLTLNAEEIALCERLRSLKLSGMADALETQLMDPNADLVPFMERLSTIVNQEWQIRYNKKFGDADKILDQIRLQEVPHVHL